MDALSLRAIFAPAFIALAIASSVINFRLDSEPLSWLALEFLTTGLAFARPTRLLLVSALRTLRRQ